MMRVREEIEEYELDHDLKVKGHHREVKDYQIKASRRYDFRHAGLQDSKLQPLPHENKKVTVTQNKEAVPETRQSNIGRADAQMKWAKFNQRMPNNRLNTKFSIKIIVLAVLFFILVLWTMIQQWSLVSTFLSLASTTADIDERL